MASSAPAERGRGFDAGHVADPLDETEADVLARRHLEVAEVLEQHGDLVAAPRRGRRRRRRPSHRTVPLVGESSPTRILASVVLPEPFSPTSAITSPAVDVHRDVD